MATSLDWNQADDARDIVHLAVQALAEGKVVALPSESCYHAVASGLNATAMQNLGSLVRSDKAIRPTLFLRTAHEAFDYAPNISPIGSRMVLRGWPGPLELQVPYEGQRSLAHKLPEQSLEVVLAEGEFLPLRVAAHEAFQEILRLTQGPLACASLTHEGQAITDGKKIDSLCGDQIAAVINAGTCHHSNFATPVRVKDNECLVLQSDTAVPPEQLNRLGQLVILLVCTGNTCRSPMAEVLLRKKVQERFGDKSQELIHIGSAGLSAFPGSPASPEAIAVMRKRGLNLLEHQSNMVTGRALHLADLIFTMTNSHRHGILEQAPEFSAKVHLLGGSGGDVSDPFGGSEATYSACADQIEGYLDQIVEQIKENWLPKWQFA